ncbi:MAG: GntR family transcriptional regulator, partial [Anaerotignum sp.]|nr:GntR family transcriptional regulator [Anaerotignum sp.]
KISNLSLASVSRKSTGDLMNRITSDVNIVQSFMTDQLPSLSVQIVSFVKRQIFTGMAEKGESLPSRRELAAILKINPNTVQKAFRLMEEEGIVVTPPNAVSAIYWDDVIFAKIQKELTAGLVAEFVVHAKENGLTLEAVTELLKEEWAREDE